MHGNVGGAHAVGGPQQREYGFGGTGVVAVELPVTRALGLQAEAGALGLADGSSPEDARLADHGAGSYFAAMVGARVRFFGGARVAGPWVDANVGLVRTGDLSRAGFDAHAGWDLRVSKTGRWDMGPYLGYTHVIQPDDTLRPEDARIVSLGIHVALGAREEPRPRGDRDRDGVFDDEDACPDVPGRRTGDPSTNGCPRRDRDQDTIFDDEDACPDVPGVHTSDPKTNGCPREDRDKDTVYDDEDACPLVPGVRTGDPKTNGCPPPLAPDRDRDGVPDADDACPDIPGIKTTDPKTNGCPAATESVRVEKDRILLDDRIYFERDVARVRHVSWPLVEKLAKFLNANPDMVEVSIEGHTDEFGTAQANMILSAARAEAVKKLLVKFGVDEARLSTKGWGKSRPVSEGRGPEDHAKNRRVEFIVTRARPASGGAP